MCVVSHQGRWSPDFSTSGLKNPVWTRATAGDVELRNSLEWTGWSTNPVQTHLCDACGTVGGASGGYAPVSTLNGFVFWTVPQMLAELDLDQFWPATAIERFGAVVFLPSLGCNSRARSSKFRIPSAFLPRMVAPSRDAWIMGPHRPKGEDKVREWLDQPRPANVARPSAARRASSHVFGCTCKQCGSGAGKPTLFVVPSMFDSSRVKSL